MATIEFVLTSGETLSVRQPESRAEIATQLGQMLAEAERFVVTEDDRRTVFVSTSALAAARVLD